REAQLESDHVGDAALPVTGRIQLDTEVGAVALHVLDLPGAFLDGRGAQLVVSRVLVVDRAEGELGSPGPATRVAQVGERHRRVDLVDELHVHVDQVRPSLEGGHRVTTPDLVRQSLGHQIAPSLYRCVTQTLVGFLPTDKHVSPYRYQLRNMKSPSRHHSRADTQSARTTRTNGRTRQARPGPVAPHHPGAPRRRARILTPARHSEKYRDVPHREARERGRDRGMAPPDGPRPPRIRRHLV